MTLLCVFKGFQNEHLGSKDFELQCFSSEDRCEVINTHGTKEENGQGEDVEWE